AVAVRGLLGPAAPERGRRAGLEPRRRTRVGMEGRAAPAGPGLVRAVPPGPALAAVAGDAGRPVPTLGRAGRLPRGGPGHRRPPDRRDDPAVGPHVHSAAPGGPGRLRLEGAGPVRSRADPARPGAGGDAPGG